MLWSAPAQEEEEEGAVSPGATRRKGDEGGSPHNIVLHIYIYIEREREIDIYTHTCIHVYIYIYIYTNVM